METYKCPEYKVAVVDGKGIRYDLTPAVLDLTLTENKGEIAQKARIVLANVKVDDRSLAETLQVRQRVFIYASVDNKEEEVFRGFIWERPYKSAIEKHLELTCYDNLIYFQQSEEYQYFSAGSSTETICKKLCSDWGVSLVYNTDSITHPKLPLRGNLSDIFLTELLEEVRKQKGTKSVMRSTKDTVHIDRYGSNTTVYQFLRGEGGNTISTSSNISMGKMITKVIILGKEDESERAPVEATVVGDTTTYGTLQKIVSNTSGTSPADAKKEAQELIDEYGKPEYAYSVTTVDIPWVRKGDKIYVEAGDMIGHFYVTSISHDAMKKTMDMEAERV